MKLLGGSLLLIFPLIMTGCGKQNPAGAGPNPAPTVLIPEGLNERHAANFLSMARDLQKDGESKQAIEVLNELLTVYPKSDAADEARKLLADLKKRSLDAGAAAGDHDPGEMVTTRGLLTHFPQDVKSTEAWLGHEFMVGETPIRTTDKVPRDFL
ncbi:MAG: tetratricopeptide repeat protein, partial [Planctomycetales bacterium]